MSSFPRDSSSFTNGRPGPVNLSASLTGTASILIDCPWFNVAVFGYTV
jgi:hypothetical protein